MTISAKDDKAAPPVGRRERKAAETRERIFAAAIELFAKRGLHNVTIEQITERADVGKGTFFNYFANKDEVLAYFGATQVARLEEAQNRGEITGNPTERILKIIDLLACHPALTRDLANSILVAYLHLGTDAERHGATVWELTHVLARVIREGQDTGHFAPGRDPDEMALFVLGQFFLAQLTWCTGYTSELLPEIAARYTATALDSLRVAPGG
jgi:AcrR family transcriptional regulator